MAFFLHWTGSKYFTAVVTVDGVAQDERVSAVQLLLMRNNCNYLSRTEITSTGEASRLTSTWKRSLLSPRTTLAVQDRWLHTSAGHRGILLLLGLAGKGQTKAWSTLTAKHQSCKMGTPREQLPLKYRVLKPQAWGRGHIQAGIPREWLLLVHSNAQLPLSCLQWEQEALWAPAPFLPSHTAQSPW